MTKHTVSVVLYNIRSAHNVGSIFRTVDAAGAVKLYLVGHTPTPIDRFGREQKEIQKTALGAERSVAWEHHTDIHTLLRELRAEGTEIVAVEQHPSAQNYVEFQPTKNTALIFGNEVEGLPEEVCARADTIVEIPMRGRKESLNVAVSVGVVLFQLCR